MKGREVTHNILEICKKAYSKSKLNFRYKHYHIDPDFGS